jgi:hypothetical protein
LRVPVGLGVQLLRLCVQGLQAVFHALAAALILRQGNDPEQVGLGEPLELLVEPALGLVQLLAPGLQLLRQPAPALGAGEGLSDLLRRGEPRAEVLPDHLIQLVCRSMTRAGQGVSCPLVIGLPLARQT